MKLIFKFAVLMLIPLAGLGFTYWAASKSIHELAHSHVEKQAKLLMEAAKATRQYTVKHIQQKMNIDSEKIEPDGKKKVVFNKEWVPAFAARETLATIYGESQKDGSFKGYEYKEASTNPTIKEDLTSDVNGRDETGLIARLKETKLEETGEVTINAEVDEIASQATQRILGVLIPAAIFMFVSFLTGVWLLVIRPVARLSDMAEEISKGHLTPYQIPVRGNDEIAQLTASFNRMNQSLYKAVKRLKGS